MIRYWRDLAGVLLKDYRRYRQALRLPGDGYLGICNRNESLERGPDGRGYRCNWQWTSDLHAPKVLPSLGSSLMSRALRDYPTTCAARPEEHTDGTDVSFIIGHRGAERLPLLLATLRSIAAQTDCRIECIVVEQSIQPDASTSLPDWVKYVYTPVADSQVPYNRASAFNAGAMEASGRLLVLHDNDILVPNKYASEALGLFNKGYKVINLKRFIFYLGQEHTREFIHGRLRLTSVPPVQVMQNAEAGGSLAVCRRTYFELGGFDESFVGWGGEDNEFWDRAQTRRVWPYAYLPMVHLWHPPQSEKLDRQRRTTRLLDEKLSIPTEERIAELARKNFGGNWPEVPEPARNSVLRCADPSASPFDLVEDLCVE